MNRVTIAGITFFACVGLATVYITHRVFANDVGIKPFTATLHEVRFHPNGVVGYEEDYTVAFRSDGSNVHDYHRRLPNGKMIEVKMVEAVDRMERITVDYATESTSTYPLPSTFSAMAAKQASGCSVSTTASSKEPTILGYQVIVVHDGHTYGNGKSNIHDLWEAPALNCFALRRVDSPSKALGAKPPHNEVVATKVDLGEPDPALFAIPENFVERSPSERHAEFERRFGMHAPTPTEAEPVYFTAHDRSR